MQLFSHRGNNHAITASWLQFPKQVRAKSKEELKQEFIGSLIEGERYGDDDLDEKADKVKKCEDAVYTVRTHKDIIKTTKKNS